MTGSENIIFGKFKQCQGRSDSQGRSYFRVCPSAWYPPITPLTMVQNALKAYFHMPRHIYIEFEAKKQFSKK